MSSQAPRYVSVICANQSLSELEPPKPLVISQEAVNHLNIILDAILDRLIHIAQSINPSHIQQVGVSNIYGQSADARQRAFKRNILEDVELDIRRKWTDSRSAQYFAPGGQGTGMAPNRQDLRFPVQQAVDLMRWSCVRISRLADGVQDDNGQSIQAAWKSMGGSLDNDMLLAAASHICEILDATAATILDKLYEHVDIDPRRNESLCELSDLLAVCESDSTSKSRPIPPVSASIGQSFNSLPAKFQSRESSQTDSRKQRTLPARPSTSAGTGHRSNSSFGGQAPRLGRSDSTTRPSTSSETPRDAQHQGRFTKNLPSWASLSRVNLALIPDLRPSDNNGRTSANPDSGRDEEDDFDALINNNDTITVSLTPSRLKEVKNDNVPSFISHSASGGLSLGRPSPPQPLVARSPIIVDVDAESDDDDDEGSLARPRKQNLMEMIRDEEKKGGRGKATVEAAPTPRTVPAVVLGTPPPTFNNSPGSRSRETPPSRDKPYGSHLTYSASSKRVAFSRDRDNEEQDDEIIAPSVNRDSGTRRVTNKDLTKSPAREMAEFLQKSSPPPVPASYTSSGEEDIGRPKSSKGFRNLMNKVTKTFTSNPSNPSYEEGYRQPPPKHQRKKSSSISGSPEGSRASESFIRISNENSGSLHGLGFPDDVERGMERSYDSRMPNGRRHKAAESNSVEIPNKSETSTAQTFKPIRKTDGISDGSGQHTPPSQIQQQYQSVSAAERTVPVSELSFLRHIMSNATSLEEGRLLLNAMLTQMGVPLTSQPTSDSVEHRTATLLLSDQKGPSVGLGILRKLPPTPSTNGSLDIITRTPPQPAEVPATIAEEREDRDVDSETEDGTDFGDDAATEIGQKATRMNVNVVKLERAL